MTEINQIGVIGLGVMGSNILQCFANQGIIVHGWNRSAKMISHENIILHADLQDFLNHVSTILISVTNEKSVSSIFSQANIRDQLAGKNLIDTSTHSPEAAQKLSEFFENCGVQYIDCPVSGGPAGALSGTLSIMVGGKKNVFLANKKILEIVGKNVTYFGESGSGQAAKLVNQILVGIHQFATAEALHFAKSLNLDTQQVLTMIDSAAGSSYVFSRSAPQMVSGNYSEAFQTSLISKDLNNALETAKSLNLPFTELAAQKLNEHKTTHPNIDAASIFLNYNSKGIH